MKTDTILKLHVIKKSDIYTTLLFFLFMVNVLNFHTRTLKFRTKIAYSNSVDPD